MEGESIGVTRAGGGAVRAGRAKNTLGLYPLSGRKEKSSNISPDMGLKYSKHLRFMG